MSFEQPLLLAILVILPVAVALYVRRERRRGRREAFAAPALMASVTPAPAGWRRHVPFVLYGLALAALVVALARPQTTVAVDVEQATVVLVTDRSGSMASEDVQPTRLDAARRAANLLLDRLPPKVRAAAVAFNQRAGTIQAPTPDKALVRDALETLTPAGGTATGDALLLALRLARPPQQPGQEVAPAAIIVISDGASVRGRDPVAVAREAGRAKVPVHTIALGTEAGTIEVRRRDGTVETRRVPPDPVTLAEMSAVSKGRTFEAEDAERLDAIYSELGSQISKRDEKREVTAGAAGLALLLVLGAGALSLTWFGRVV